MVERRVGDRSWTEKRRQQYGADPIAAKILKVERVRPDLRRLRKRAYVGTRLLRTAITPSKVNAISTTLSFC
jgi:hypothetical protein